MEDDNCSPTPRDDGLDWLRQIRRDILAEANNDPVEMVRCLREKQKGFTGRIIRYRESAQASAIVAEGPPVDSDALARGDVSSRAGRKLPYDDGLEWLRQIRRDMLAEAGGDPLEMGRRLRAKQDGFTGKIIRYHELHPEKAMVAEEPPRGT